MRRRLVVSFLAVLALLVTGCDLRLIDPPGEGAVRYRDLVFASATTTSDVVYGTATGADGQPATLRLDLRQPTGDTVAKRPVIVFVHGGSFAFGTKTSPEIVDQATTFARKGYVTASISYRLSSPGCTSVGADCINAIRRARSDAQAAVRFLRSKAAAYRLDTSRIAIGGTSAGAITALEVAYGSDDLGDNTSNRGYASTVKAAVSLSGAKILTNPDPGEPSVLLFHGTTDTLVPYTSAANTVTAAEAAGLHAELTTWEGEGHVPYGPHRNQIIDETTNFLWWTMNLKAAAV